MPRPDRVFVEGGVYHVYNRIGRGERVFDGAEESAAFVELLRRVVSRDGLTVYAWCLMSNHYHLAVRTGEITLDRPMRSLQQGVTRSVNVRRKVFGPLWQGRYRAKLVEDQRYLDQLLIYIHLNPVSAGLMDDPADYPWSGHGEILGRVKKPIVDVDEVLRVFGETRRSARATYVRRLKGAVEAEWIGEAPGRLPWWRLGRPPKGEDEDPEEAVRQRRRRGVEGPDWRPRLSAEEFAPWAADALHLEMEDLCSRKRSPELVRARELVMALGVEGYGLKVRELAATLKKTPDGMSHALARGVRRRADDERFRRELRKLDRVIATGSTRT
jgi:REP element-mobilizing transposase RayT